MARISEGKMSYRKKWKVPIGPTSYELYALLLCIAYKQAFEQAFELLIISYSAETPTTHRMKVIFVLSNSTTFDNMCRF